MTKDLHVSVIIPAYMAAATIGRAIESVLAQTRPPKEILVIDDGSTDDLRSALSAYRKEVTLLRKPNGGVASARNLGMDHARGELIAFLDADDYWMPAKLERQVEIFERSPGVGVCASRLFWQLPGQPLLGPGPPVTDDWDRVSRVSGAAAFGLATHISTPTVVVRRSALGEERFDTSLESAEDRDLWVRLVASMSVYLLSEPLTTVVLEPNSLSRTSVDSDCESMLRVVHRYSGLLGQRGLRHWEAHVYRRLAGGRLEQGRAREAMRPAYRRLCREPWSPEAWWILLKSACRSPLGSRRRERRMAVEHGQQEVSPLQQVRDA